MTSLSVGPSSSMPISLAMGPFTSRSEACDPVDMRKKRAISGSSLASAFSAAKMTGSCSGLAPAIAALIAIFSTVASPHPGATSHSTQSGGKQVPVRSRSTASAVGGSSGKPSPQSRPRNASFMRSSASS